MYGPDRDATAKVASASWLMELEITLELAIIDTEFVWRGHWAAGLDEEAEDAKCRVEVIEAQLADVRAARAEGASDE